MKTICLSRRTIRPKLDLNSHSDGHRRTNGQFARHWGIELNKSDGLWEICLERKLVELAFLNSHQCENGHYRLAAYKEMASEDHHDPQTPSSLDNRMLVICQLLRTCHNGALYYGQSRHSAKIKINKIITQ